MFDTRRDMEEEWKTPGVHVGGSDLHACEHAIRHGYDSIQIDGRPEDHFESIPWDPPEVAYCAGSCARVESLNVCPEGIPLLRDDGSECACDTASPLLRCLEHAQGQAGTGSSASQLCEDDPCQTQAGRAACIRARLGTATKSPNGAA